MWTCPGGHKQLLPKDQGQGIMLLLLCCGEHEHGFNPSTKSLDAENKIRTGKDYSDADAKKRK